MRRFIELENKKKNEMIARIKNASPIYVDPSYGLSEEEVKTRLNENLLNKTPKNVTKTYWRIFVDNFFSFFNMVFLAIVILLVVAGADISYFFFTLPIICNIALGLICDIHARRMVDKLRLVTEPKVTVIRDGKENELPLGELVLSDIYILRAGDQIPTDSTIVQGSITVDEALLTGESDPIFKEVGASIYGGSYVKSGTARAQVTSVGIANYAESLQQEAKKFSRPKSELKKSCLLIFRFTGIGAVILGFAMLLTWLIQSVIGGDLNYASYSKFAIENFSGSLTAMIPAGLYLLTSLTLSIGVINLASKRMHVQELYCIEMLARVDVICFDKTGTITDGKLKVLNFYSFSNLFSKEELKKYIIALVTQTGDKNATAEAILELKDDFDNELTTIAFWPFDSSKKQSAVSFKDLGTFVMGAQEFIDGKKDKQALSLIKEEENTGKRVISIFYSPRTFAKNEKISDLELVGYVSFSDHIKDDAFENIAWFQKNGVEVKIISGDNSLTVSRIAEEVGVKNAQNSVSLESVSDDELIALSPKTTVFGRVKPEQKALIIESLQKSGHVVAMTGDGVNDILALKKSDCSIAMASGSSATRNIAHIVSLDNDFSKLPRVVFEGRRVINNLQRTSSLFLAKTVFAFMMTIVFLISQWCGGPRYPFTTKNMVLWEVVTIGLGGFLLALQPSNERLQGSFLINTLKRAFPAGIVAVLSCLIIFLITIINPSLISFEQARAMAVILFSLLSFCTLFRICWPFDLYRILVYGGLLILAFALLFVDLYTRFDIFDINFSILGGLNYGICAGIFVGAAALYALLDYLFSKWKIKRRVD